MHLKAVCCCIRAIALSLVEAYYTELMFILLIALLIVLLFVYRLAKDLNHTWMENRSSEANPVNMLL